MSLGTLWCAAALVADVSLEAILQVGDLARVCAPDRHYYFRYITTMDWHQDSVQQIISQLSVVLALDSLNYYSEKQGLTAQHFTLNVCLAWLHWIRGSVLPCSTSVYQKVEAPFLFYFTYMFNCIKKIVQSCRYAGLPGLALQSSSSNCLVLKPHRQLRNYIVG